MSKYNIIFCDCRIEEILDFKQGIEMGTGSKYDVVSSINNGGHGGLFQNLIRYVKYFIFPFFIFLRKKKYREIIGWQQFYAINIAFFCRLFKSKKTSKVIVANFTYKEKAGIIGGIYHRYMKYAVCNDYVDYLHVLSYDYANSLSEALNIPRKKIIVTPFGVSDMYTTYSLLENPFGDSYSMSIGRSNRDFDFLVDIWKEKGFEKENLVIISDTWQPKSVLPPNVNHYTNIVGKESFAWFANCKLSITPILDGSVCSGDTVLLTGMMLKKTTVITAPSTLSEMYIENGYNGVCIPKDKNEAATILINLLHNNELQTRLGENARETFLKKFSRESMGYSIAKAIKE